MTQKNVKVDIRAVYTRKITRENIRRALNKRQTIPYKRHIAFEI